MFEKKEFKMVHGKKNSAPTEKQSSQMTQFLDVWRKKTILEDTYNVRKTN
jgi:hypothetical protein